MNFLTEEQVFKMLKNEPFAFVARVNPVGTLDVVRCEPWINLVLQSGECSADPRRRTWSVIFNWKTKDGRQGQSVGAEEEKKWIAAILNIPAVRDDPYIQTWITLKEKEQRVYERTYRAWA